MPIAVLPAVSAIARANVANRGFLAPLRPVLIGPRAGLHRFAVLDERAFLENYDPLADHDVAYPNKESDSTVDLSSVVLYANSARLNYFNKYIGANGTCQPSSTYPNRVRASNYIFKTGNGYNRSSDFGDRDVKIGDVVQIRQGGTTVNTTVAGFVGEPVAAVTAAATADANNKGGQAASTSIQQVAGTPINDVVATADGSNYRSAVDGYITRTYLITVIQASAGGDATTARLRVQSADGGDDQASITPAAFASPTSIGTRGLTVTFSINEGHSSSSLFGIPEHDFVLGQQWSVTVSQLWTAPVATSAGTYTGSVNDTYIVTVSLGGRYTDATQPQITVTAANGSDSSGPTTVTATATPIAIGHHGVTIAFDQNALRKGDVYYVQVTAAAQAQYRTIITTDDIPSSLDSVEVDLRLFANRDGITIPKNRSLPTQAANWSCDAASVLVKAGIYLTDAEFTASGVLFGVPLDSAEIYVQYREWVTTDGATVIVLSNPDDIVAHLGTIDVTNPIAQAAALALANTAGELAGDPTRPAATTTDEVLCIPIGGDPTDTTLWASALDAIVDDDRAYDLVPLSTLDAVRSLFVAHVASQSSDDVGFYLSTWLAASINETGAVVSPTTSTDHNVVTATITADPDSSPTAYTIVTASANAAFVTNGVRAGDTVRINYGTDIDGNETYTSYEVASVVSNTTLKLVSGPVAAIGVARRIEVWRTYTKDELAAQLVAKAATYASDRVRYVWPDRAAFGGTTYDGYLVCSALAGLAGSVPSQQGLRNIGLEGIDDASRAGKFFTSAEIKTLRDGGVFVVGQTPTGTIYIASASTTDPSSTGTREEMQNRNADMIRKAIQSAWAPYVGSGNVTSNLQPLLSAALASLTAQLKAANWTKEIGPPVGNLTLTSLSSVVGHSDQVDVSVTASGLPSPLNVIKVRLTVG